MADLPYDILTEILRYIARDSQFDWSNLSLVSRLIHEIILPYKFRKLCFTSVSKGCTADAPLWTEPRSIQFCRALNKKDEHALAIAPYVLECSLKDWDEDRRTLEITDAMVECFKAFTALPNLIDLVLINTIVYPPVLEHLGQLEQLRSFHLVDCHLLGGYNFRLLSKLKTLTSLRFSGPSNRQVEMLCLHIPKENLKIFESGNWARTRDVLKFEPLIQLTKLSISSTIEKPDILWRYLERASSLTYLSLLQPNDPSYRLPWDDAPPPSVTLRLPQLRYLRASVRSALPFSAQPMKELDIVIVRDDDLEIAVLMKGRVFPNVEDLAFSVPLTKLLLPEEYLQQSFPNLRSLKGSKGLD